MSTELSNDTENDVSDTLLERLRVATAGTYDIAGILGRGGMAVVFVAEDLRLRRTVAIKVMEPSLSLIPGMAERFLEEARTLARLQHPNVIVVHDVQRSKGLSFFVMTLIEGGGVDELCRGTTPLPIDQAQWILLGAARALAFAHSERIIHRDVKPANILVNVKGDVVLTDFGIAKGVDGTGMTKSGTQIGTPVYMSPEQFTGEAVGPASDQYALGVTAYQLLTGAPPFSGELYALIAAHGTRIPVPIRQLRPDCPAYLANAVMRMLEKLPQERWPSLDDLSDVFAANLPSDGGVTRKQLASAARALHVERRRAVQALSAQPPLSPVPTHASRATAPSAVPTLVVTVSPPGATIFVGGSLELRASVTLENGQPVTDAAVRWMSSAPDIVAVDATGRLTGVAPGKAIVQAQLDGGVSEAQITIEAAPIARLALPTSDFTVCVGDVLQPPVSAIDVTGTARPDVTLTWVSRAPEIAVLDGLGVVRAVSPGRGVIEVSFGNLRQLINVMVLRRPITRVSIRSGPPTLELGATRQLMLDAFDDRGESATAVAPQWRSSAPAVIHLDSTGRALAISRGAARISVMIDDATDAIDLVAVESPVAAVQLQLESLVMEIDDTAPVRLRVTDATGGIRSADSVRVWSSDASLAVVDESQMMIRAIAPGAVHIYAQSIVDGVPGVSATQSITVRAPATVRINASPAQIDLEEGTSVAVSIRAYDRRGRGVPDAQVVWTSESVAVATVDADGVVRGLSIGSGMICARVPNPDGVTAETRIPVLVRPNRSVAITPEPPALRAPNFTPVSPTVPLPRAVPSAEAPGVPPIAPTIPMLRPERMATPPHRKEAGGTGATVAPAVPLVQPAPASPVVPSAFAAERHEIHTATPGTGAPRRGSRNLLLGGGVVVVVIAFWALTKGPSAGDAPATSTPPSTAVPATAVPAPAGSAPAPGATTGSPPANTSTSAATAVVVPTPPRSATGSGGVQPAPAPPPNRGGPAPTPRTAAPRAVPTTGPTVVEPQKTPAPVAPVDNTPDRESRPKGAPVLAPAPPPEGTTRRPEPAKVVELADASELRVQAERFVGRLRAGAERNAELSAFFSDGDDHKVAVVGAPESVSETGGRTEAQFDIRLTKFDAAGRRTTRVATVTLEVVKRDGTVSTTSTSVGALRSPR